MNKLSTYVVFFTVVGLAVPFYFWLLQHTFNRMMSVISVQTYGCKFGLLHYGTMHRE